jgi:hypothetical protein
VTQAIIREPTDARPAQRVSRSTSWQVFGVFVVLTLLGGTGAMVWDAGAYWSTSHGLLTEFRATLTTAADFRGIFVGFVFLPAAAVAAVLGEQFVLFGVLLQNALVFGWVAAFLLPRVVIFWRPFPVRSQWIGALLLFAVLIVFAPFSLMDVYAAVGLLIVLVLLRSDRLLLLLSAGVISGVLLNLRPAYVIVLALVAVVLVVWRRWASLLFPLGVLIALVPQTLYNLHRFQIWALWPAQNNEIVALQAGFASYIIRYDTFLAGGSATKFFCSPTMAQQLGTATPPESSTQLAGFFLQTLPNSAVFAMEKISASLHWALSTPYLIPSPGLDLTFSVLITAITVVGIVALLLLAVRTKGHWLGAGRRDWVLVGAIVLGVAITLVASATESRFALPLVLLGVAGLAAFAAKSPKEIWAAHRRWVLAAAVAVLAVFILGTIGLSHPAVQGPVTPSICATR